MTLRTDAELDEALTVLSEQLRISKQEVIRRSVLELRDRTSHRARVAESAERMLERWGPVLDRLGKA